jgi:hypothetical protein
VRANVIKFKSSAAMNSEGSIKMLIPVEKVYKIW